MRVSYADSTLVRVPDSSYSDETTRWLLTLSDVMCTGHHAAVSAQLSPESVVAVVGDGAVGLRAKFVPDWPQRVRRLSAVVPEV